MSRHFRCKVCNSEILVMCFRGTEVCSELCRKKAANPEEENEDKGSASRVRER